MLDRQQIQALVPHQGAMCLWDNVLHWDAQHIVLQAHSHRDARHPLRTGAALHAVHLCEYGAQAMAVHGGLLADGGPARAGMLVALRDVQLHCERIDPLDGLLRGEADLLAAGDASQQYAFRVLHNDTLLAEGRAAVMLQLPGQSGR